MQLKRTNTSLIFSQLVSVLIAPVITIARNNGDAHNNNRSWENEQSKRLHEAPWFLVDSWNDEIIMPRQRNNSSRKLLSPDPRARSTSRVAPQLVNINRYVAILRRRNSIGIPIPEEHTEAPVLRTDLWQKYRNTGRIYQWTIWKPIINHVLTFNLLMTTIFRSMLL